MPPEMHHFNQSPDRPPFEAAGSSINRSVVGLFNLLAQRYPEMQAQLHPQEHASDSMELFIVDHYYKDLHSSTQYGPDTLIMDANALLGRIGTPRRMYLPQPGTIYNVRPIRITDPTVAPRIDVGKRLYNEVQANGMPPLRVVAAILRDIELEPLVESYQNNCMHQITYEPVAGQARVDGLEIDSIAVLRSILATVLWDERSEELVAEPAVYGLLEQVNNQLQDGRITNL